MPNSDGRVPATFGLCRATRSAILKTVPEPSTRHALAIMELKVICNCGQKYKFDVEPVQGRMPFSVQCPVCGMDGTPTANSNLSELIPPVSQPAVAKVAPFIASVAAPAPVVRVVGARPAGVASLAPVGLAATQPQVVSHNLALGIAGALLGAVLGVGLMYGFFLLAGFRFPLLGIGIGALTGYGARLLYRGTDMTLGVAAAIIAFLAVAGILFMMFGAFAIVNIITLLVSVSIAYQIAS